LSAVKAPMLPPRSRVSRTRLRLYVTLAQRIKARARELGFDLVGIARAEPPATFAAYREWVDRGYGGEMDYLRRPDRVQRRRDPNLIVPDAKSVVVVGKNYFTRDLPPDILHDPARGIVASYAWGLNYHDIMMPRLRELQHFIVAEVDGDVYGRAYVDTGPVLERAYAERAGLGFVGRNTMLIHPRWGSWLFLGEVLVDVALEPDLPDTRGTCGACTRCLEACPTDAFPEPYVLDARRCISYLTIELKGPIPLHLRQLMGNRIFGCDICNEVCPWNRQFARITGEPGFQPDPDRVAPKLLDLIRLDEAMFRARFRNNPIRRAKRRGLLRNVAVALGNWGDPRVVPALESALQDHEPLIRGHVAWALGQIQDPSACKALRRALRSENDRYVRDEIATALGAAAVASTH
jgi:epoxyqueuosine reductase